MTDEKKCPRKRIDIVTLKMVKETSTHYARRKVEIPDDAAEIFQELHQCCDREKFSVLCLDVKNHPTNLSTICIGGLDSSIVDPKKIFSLALLSNSQKLIIAHHHPSGDPTPSTEDIELTDRLKKAGELLGIQVIDHIILGDKCFTSSANRWENTPLESLE